QGESAEAVPFLRTAFELDPGYGPAAYQLGRALARQEKWQEAEEALGQAVRLARRRRGEEPAPWLLPARCALGRVLSHRGQAQAAREQYQEALALEPGWPQ